MDFPQWVIDALKILIGTIFGAWGIEIYRAKKRKKRETIEISKIYGDSESLQIHIKTNIEKIVETKTADLTKQVSELEKTIVQISTKYRTDLDRYIERMADLEDKLDEQNKRNQEIEKQLGEEVTLRLDCAHNLRILQDRINEIESQNRKNDQNNRNATRKS